MGKRDALMLKADSIAGFFLNERNRFQFALDRNKQLFLSRNECLKISEEDCDVCFVIGNGPSAKADNLKLIEGFPSITVNFFHKQCGEYKSKYHLMIDPSFAKCGEHYAYTQSLFAKEKTTTFIVSYDLGNSFWGQRMRGMADNIFLVDTNLVQYGKQLRTDMCKPMTACPNVIPMAIQCVLYMGYKHIYLLGCEFGLYGNPESRGGYFYENEVKKETNEHDSPDNLIRCGLVHMHHEAIVDYCKCNGIEIVNITPNSNLGEYELGDINEVLRRIQGK